MVKNQTFRHDLGVRLSEAIVKKLTDERPTSYRKPKRGQHSQRHAHSRNKRILSETNDDDPRAIDAAISASVEWVSREGEFSMTFGQIHGLSGGWTVHGYCHAGCD